MSEERGDLPLGVTDDPDDLSEEDAEAQAHLDAALQGYDSSDKRQVGKARRRAKARTERAEDFWRRVVADPIGRQELWEHLQATGFFEPPFQMTATGVPDQFACWYAVGLAHAGRLLYDKVFLADPESTLLMHRENDARWPKRKG